MLKASRVFTPYGFLSDILLSMKIRILTDRVPAPETPRLWNLYSPNYDRAKNLNLWNGRCWSHCSFKSTTVWNAEITCVVRSGYEHIAENGYQISSLTYGRHEKFSPKHLVKNAEDASHHGWLCCSIDQKYPRNHQNWEFDCSSGFSRNINSANSEWAWYRIAFFKKVFIILSGVSQIGSENKNGILNHYGGVDRLSIGYFENDRLSAQQQELGAKKFVSL